MPMTYRGEVSTVTPFNVRRLEDPRLFSEPLRTLDQQPPEMSKDDTKRDHSVTFAVRSRKKQALRRVEPERQCDAAQRKDPLSERGSQQPDTRSRGHRQTFGHRDHGICHDLARSGEVAADDDDLGV